MSDEIKLGHPIEDRITGFMGIAYSKIETLTGNTMFGIQPRSEKTDEVKDAKLFDVAQVRIKTRGQDVAMEATEPKAESFIPLGLQVRDKLRSSLFGIAYERATYINGCVFYDVVLDASIKVENTVEPHVYLSAERLEVIGPGVAGTKVYLAYKSSEHSDEQEDETTADMVTEKSAVEKPAVEKPAIAKRGGPIRNAPSVR